MQSRSLRLKYFELIKISEVGSVACTSTSAIFSWGITLIRKTETTTETKKRDKDRARTARTETEKSGRWCGWSARPAHPSSPEGCHCRKLDKDRDRDKKQALAVSLYGNLYVGAIGDDDNRGVHICLQNHPHFLLKRRIFVF